MKALYLPVLLLLLNCALWSCVPTAKIQLPPAIDTAYRVANYEFRYSKKSSLQKVFEYRLLRDTLLLSKDERETETSGIILPRSVYYINRREKEQQVGTDSFYTLLRFSITKITHEAGHHSLLGDILFPPKDDPYSHSATTTSHMMLLFTGAMQVPGMKDSARFFFERKKVMDHHDTARLGGYIRMAGDSFYLRPFYTYISTGKKLPPQEQFQGYEMIRQDRLYAYFQYHTGFSEPRKLHLYKQATREEQLVLAAYFLLLCSEFMY